MTVVISAYRSNLMPNLPWRLFILKGIFKTIELMILDVGELPSFKTISYVREDFILISASVCYLFSVDERKYRAKMEHLRRTGQLEHYMSPEIPSRKASSTGCLETDLKKEK